MSLNCGGAKAQTPQLWKLKLVGERDHYSQWAMGRHILTRRTQNLERGQMGGQWSMEAIQGTAGSPRQEEAGEMVVGWQADRGHPGQRRTWMDIGDKHQRHYVY